MRIRSPYQLNVTTELKWDMHTVACFKSVSPNNVFLLEDFFVIGEVSWKS
jgi:hypothetical protein